MKVKVESVTYSSDGIFVNLITAGVNGERDYVGYAKLGANSFSQYKPGEVYELTLTLQQPVEQVIDKVEV